MATQPKRLSDDEVRELQSMYYNEANRAQGRVEKSSIMQVGFYLLRQTADALAELLDAREELARLHACKVVCPRCGGMVEAAVLVDGLCGSCRYDLKK